jgi:hypothetical protein
VRYQEATAFMLGYRPSEAFDRFHAIAERKDDPWRAMASTLADRRGPPVDPGRAGAARTLRLRVSPQRYGQSVRLPRCPPALAHRQGHRQRTARDFAECMRDVVDLHYPMAETIRVVLDNLSTRSPGTLYEAFPAPEARRILRRLEFHFTLKHASWLNMVEIEIGVLRSQCLDRRIDNRQLLEAEVAEWERQRNAQGARVKWMFATQRARIKMLRAYPDPSNES